ncbi:MAG: hypothetical protein LBQ66_10700 [Planctomycetaceae bacterium]|jgi:hypothetical protein|nr:hypothetical protein [Planctomycetaceae bacterium]
MNVNTSDNKSKIGERNVATDCNNEVRFVKASIESHQQLFCNWLAGTSTRKLVEHYDMLYWLRKRGGIFRLIGGDPIATASTLFARFLRLCVCCLCVLFCSMIFCGGLVADEIVWKTDFNEAMQLAKYSGKNLLIYFYAKDAKDIKDAKDTEPAADNDSRSDSNDKSNNDDAPKTSDPKTSDTKISDTKRTTSNRTSTNSNRNQTRTKQSQNQGSGQRSVQGQSQDLAGSFSVICREFERGVLGLESVVCELERYVLVRLPLDSRVLDERGEFVSVIGMPMFREMVGMPGLVIVDFENADESYYEDVVGVLPFIYSVAPSSFQTLTFLTIPSGTLSQRTLTYAVKVHPDRPLSADGDVEVSLLVEATDHAAFQAKNRVLGHHNYSARSSRIRAILGTGISEVCAQSGLYSSQFEAAIACVRGWRGSPAHWRCVRAKQKYYAYDMVQSSNGLWYATGLFVSP